MKRERVLSLYRYILKSCKNWKAVHEREMIESEAKALFRYNRSIEDEEEIDAKIFEAETRIGLAEHYGTAKPRPYLVPQKLKLKNERFVPAYMHSYVPHKKPTTHTSDDQLKREY